LHRNTSQVVGIAGRHKIGHSHCPFLKIRKPSSAVLASQQAGSCCLGNATSRKRARCRFWISVLVGYGLQVHRNQLLAMLGAFDNVKRRFLAAHRVNELFNRSANELRLTPEPIRRSLEFRLFGEFHPGLQNAFSPTVPTHDAGEANRSEDHPGAVMRVCVRPMMRSAANRM